MIASSEFQDYLQEICRRYEEWWVVDALTETIATRQATFFFEQMVLTEDKEKKREEKPQKVSLPIFKGIQNYVESEHILLVGSPGVGKSTALLRCLVSFAKKELEKPEPRIPVLVRLKEYHVRFSSSEDPSGMLTLIRNALKPQLRLKIPEIEELLFQKRLILLLDGLNEMPADTVRTQLKAFREECRDSEIPLISTTRELGSGDLGIKRRLEIQPLNSSEIDRFLRECMPSQAQRVWQLLSRDNRELSRTPFVLWMLYQLFQETGVVVETLGEAFRQFFRYFKKYKEDAPTTDERRKAWNPWLEYLAFTMLNSTGQNDSGLVISDELAEKILAEKFGELYGSSSRIEELLKYHLLERISDREISFHHQLIQEYYGAEYLLPQLTRLIKKQSGQKYTAFEIDYLNQLKWTEPISIMLGLPEIKDNPARRIIELSLEVDLYLGARLAGEVKPQLQEQTVRLVSAVKQFNGQDVQECLQIELLGKTKSNKAVPKLRSVLHRIKFHQIALVEWGEDPQAETIHKACEALGEIASDESVHDLLEVLKDPDFYMRASAAGALGEIKSYKAVHSLIQEFESITTYINELCEVECDTEKHEEVIGNHIQDATYALDSIAYALGNIGDEEAVFILIQELNDPYSGVRASVANALGCIRDKCAIPALIEALEDHDYEVRKSVVDALSNIGEAAVPDLREALKYLDSDTCVSAIEVLSKIGTDAAVSALREACENPDSDVHESAIEAIEEITNADFTTPIEINNQRQNEFDIYPKRTQTINKIESESETSQLLKALENPDLNVRRLSVDKLGKIGTPIALAHLWILQVQAPSWELVRAIAAIQSRCGFYNYEIVELASPQTMEGRKCRSEDFLQDKLDIITYEIKEIKKVSEEPKGIITTQNYFEQGTHTHTHNYANNETLKQQIPELRQLVHQLQQTHQPTTEVQAAEIIDVEFSEIQQTNPTRWQTIRKQLQLLNRQILNPESHLKATKATLAEVTKHYLEESVVSKALITYLDTMSGETDQGE
ncbi:MAG: HEAT repeat domain-containing protein [Coleofasciculaceae cyanobacterium]